MSDYSEAYEYLERQAARQPFCADEAAHIYAHHDDALTFLRTLPDASVHAVITDPPYGLADHKPERVVEALTAWASGDRERVPTGKGFMGREWDAFVPPPAVWDECLRVLVPGGHLAVFAGSRTVDLMGLSIRLAGFEMRDGMAAWLYSQGFPKSRNVSADPCFCQCETGPAVPSNNGDRDLHGVREDVRDSRGVVETGEVTDLLTSVQREGTRPGVGHARPQGLCGEVAGEPGSVRDARRSEPCVAGRGDVQAREGQLRRPAVREVPAGPDGDGEDRRLRDGASPRHGEDGRAPADAHGVRGPRGPRPSQQRPVEPQALPDERGPQARRGRPVCERCGKPPVAPGIGTALKPAHEPILLARKPLDGTVAGSVLAHGAGGINVDACRVGMSDADRAAARVPMGAWTASNTTTGGTTGRSGEAFEPAAAGRWPTNVVLAHHPSCGPDGASGPCVDGCQVAALDAQSGSLTSGQGNVRRESGADRSGNTSASYGAESRPAGSVMVSYGDTGGASRFFPTFRYQAKAPKTERPIVDGRGHPTVKPLGLMRWLTRLLCPPGGTVLDPFAGSGATLEAARLEGARAVGVERDEHSCKLIAERLGVTTLGPIVGVADPADELLTRVYAAGSVDELMELYRQAVAEQLWCDEIKTVFTARKMAVAS